MSLPLSGISVVEYSTGMAGRLAGLLLADQGATVIVSRAYSCWQGTRLVGGA
jgi:crotonobetainyl-CoA:carnitine CoA-transferase CaiB-like acyl-CoA transferase